MPKLVLSVLSTGANHSLQVKDWQALIQRIEEKANNKTAAASLNLFNYKVWAYAHANASPFAKAWQQIV